MISQAGDAPRLHFGEKGGAVTFPVKHHGKAVKQRIGVKLIGARLVRHILFKTGNDVAFEDLQQSGIDRLTHHEKRLAVHRIDPIVGGGAQAQALARHIMLRQLLGGAVVDANVAVDIEDGGLVRSLIHPFLAQFSAPRHGLVLVGQMLELDAQGAHFRRPVEAEQFAPFSRRVIAQLLHRFEPGERHESEQQKDRRNHKSLWGVESICWNAATTR